MDDPDPANTDMFFRLAVLVAILLLNALASAGHSAITALNDAHLQKLAEDGDKKAKRVARIVADSKRFVNSVRLCSIFLCVAGTAFAVRFYSAPALDFAAGLISADTAPLWAEICVTVLLTVIIAFVFMTVSIQLPKKLGAQHAEKAAFALSGYMAFITALFYPFSAFNNCVAGLLARLFGADPNADVEVVTEEEIRMMVDVGKENGVIEESQKAMINNIFEFDDIVASDVMTHRTDMVAVSLKDSFDDVVNLAIKEGCSRIPAYDEDIDDIKGIIYVKDLLKYVGHELPEGGLTQIMRAAHFVPETKKCGDLFTEMTERRIQMCIVSDEYGGTAGLVTIEDLLESIVGNIQDEYDDEEEDEIEQINDTTFTVDGTTNINEINEQLGIELPEGDYDTVGGMIMSIIGRIPDSGEHVSVEADGWTFTVEESSDRRIERVSIKKLPSPDENEK